MILCETLNQKNCHLIQVSNQIKSQVQSAQLHMISYDDIVLNLQSSRKGKKISYMKPIVIRYSLVVVGNQSHGLQRIGCLVASKRIGEESI